MFDAFLVAAMPHLLEILAALVSLILAWAANTARLRWHIQIEAAHRDTLHSAIMTGLKLALSRGANRSQAIESAVQWAQSQGAPDAVRALKVSGERLAGLARSKIDDIRP